MSAQFVQRFGQRSAWANKDQQDVNPSIGKRTTNMRSSKVFATIIALAASTPVLADDVKVGKLTSFPRSVKLKPGETVVFAWITYKSRAQRDRINAKVMKDPRLAEMMNPKAMPFDGKRMFWGGFEVLVEA